MEPRKGRYAMLIELKRSRDDLYKKDGVMRGDKHIIEQRKVLGNLNAKGYYAVFACGFKEARIAIDGYMDSENLKTTY